MSKEDIKKRGYKIFLTLRGEGISAYPPEFIYTRHKKEPGIVTVFEFDGIHYIDRIIKYHEI